MAIDESAQSPLMESGFDCGVSSKPKDGDDSDMSQSVCNGKQCAVGTMCSGNNQLPHSLA